MKKLIPILVVGALIFGWVIFQANYSKNHHIYLNLDNGIYYHDCGYGHCVETKDESGTKCFYCTNCDKIIYK